MARLARVVAPGVPHHVIQHGNHPPLGDDAFVERLESSLGRNLCPRKPDPKPRKMPRQPRD